MPRADRLKQFREPPVGIRSRHQVHLVAVQKGLLEPFGHAAHYAYHNARPVLPGLVEAVNPAPYPLLGIVADRTGVGHYDISLLHLFGTFIPVLRQYGEYHLGVIHIHLASISFYVKLSHFNSLNYNPVAILPESPAFTVKGIGTTLAKGEPRQR